jgi:topoisomerase IA-like protein
MTPYISNSLIQNSVYSIPTIGDYDGHPITKHKGQYGPYIKWKDINVSVKAEDDLTAIIQKIKAKLGPSATGGGSMPTTGPRGGAGGLPPKAAQEEQKVGPFAFKTGPYGPYMFKSDLKTKKFVSVPAGTDPSKLTIREADEIYKKGLEDKAEKAKKGAKFAAIKAAKGL